DELPLRRREVAVGDVDGDALLALGAQPVGQQRQVRLLEAHALAGVGHRLELVLEDRLRVVEQPPDERRLAVVDRAGGREPQQLAHQKYPCRFRSSMAASEARSSARVAPRSVRRVAATSSITACTSAAVDSTAPVQDASPTVRKRTVRTSGTSPSIRVTYGVT